MRWRWKENSVFLSPAPWACCLSVSPGRVRMMRWIGLCSSGAVFFSCVLLSVYLYLSLYEEHHFHPLSKNKRKVWWCDFMEFNFSLAVGLQADSKLQLSEGSHFHSTHHTHPSISPQPTSAIQPSLSQRLIQVLSGGRLAAVWTTCKPALEGPEKVNMFFFFFVLLGRLSNLHLKAPNQLLLCTTKTAGSGSLIEVGI